MARKKLAPVHPGEILLEEFLMPMEVSQYRLAKDISVSPRRINEIVHGQRSITAVTHHDDEGLPIVGHRHQDDLEDQEQQSAGGGSPDEFGCWIGTEQCEQLLLRGRVGGGLSESNQHAKQQGHCQKHAGAHLG